MKFQMAIRTLAIPLKMAMKKDAMAEMTALIAPAMAEMMLPIVVWVFVVSLSLFFPSLSFLQEGGKNEEAAKGGKRAFSFIFFGPLIVDPSVPSPLISCSSII